MDKTYARFVVTVSASVEDINVLSDSVENLTQALVEDIDDKCTVYNGSTIRVKFNELHGYDYDQPAEQSVQADGDYCTCPPSVPRYDVGDGWKCHWCKRPRR